MANEENLRPQWKKGESGNLKGYPTGKKNRSTIIKELLAAIHVNGKSNEHQMNQAMLDKALEGDLASIKEILDTVYGKTIDKSMVAEVSQEELGVDVTAEALKHVPQDELEKLMEAKEVTE